MRDFTIDVAFSLAMFLIIASFIFLGLLLIAPAWTVAWRLTLSLSGGLVVTAWVIRDA